MKTATFTIISGRKDIDSFMKGADLFRGKNLGTTHDLKIKYSDSTDLNFWRAKEAIQHIKDALEKTGQIVSFIFLQQIQVDNTIYLNTQIKPYVDFKAREVSNGTKAFVLKDFIELSTPFKCETDENFYITNLK